MYASICSGVVRMASTEITPAVSDGPRKPNM